MSESSLPRRGDVWLVNFDPTIGDEIRKTRPAVVLSSDSVGRLRLKLAAPLTGWNPQFADLIWLVRVDPEPGNGVDKPSAVDVLQSRGMDLRRFVRRLGHLSPVDLTEVVAALALVVEVT